MKVPSPGPFWWIMGILWILLSCMILGTLVEEEIRANYPDPLPTAELREPTNTLERSKAVTAGEFTEILGAYLSGLPWVLWLTVGNLMGWMAAAALPRMVTRAVTEGRFQYVLISVFGALCVIMPLIGPLHWLQREYPFIFLISFNIVLNGGLWLYWKYVFLPNENKRLREMKVGVNTVQEMAEELVALRQGYSQYKQGYEELKGKLGQMEKDLAAARAAK